MDKDNNIIKPIGTLTPDLRKAVDNIKQAILESQLRATKYANSVELSLYYGIGHYISDNSRDGYWGTNAIETISEQLQKELPGLRGYSATSLKSMRRFYEVWKDDIKRQNRASVKSAATAADLDNSLNVNPNELIPLNRQPSAGEITDLTTETMVAADFVGVVSGKKVKDKVAKTGWKVEKGEHVNAPVFTDFPMTMECRIERKIDESETGYYIVAKIVNIRVNEEYLAEDGKPDLEKMHLLTFDPVHLGYLEIGKRVGNAFKDGTQLK